MIAYVEFYRPMYFLLENVGGILEHALKEKTVASGVVKFIHAALIALKYDLVNLCCSILIFLQLPDQI
jgi:DNA (cytosine-5)-methyltransferase 1